MENTTEAGVWLCGVWCVGRGAKTTTEDDDAATLHHTCILNLIYFIYLYWVSVEVLTAFLVGINGVSVRGEGWLTGR